MRKNKTKNNKSNKNRNNMDIIETRVRRFVAMIIDWYLTNMLAVIPITFYLRGNDYLKPYMFDLTHYDFSIGQTLGKKICKIKIIKENNESINLKDMMLRELLGASLLEGGMIIIPTYIRKLLPLFKLTMIVDPLKYIAYALTIGSIIYAYFQANTQSFHDKVAKTIVVKQ